MSSWAASIERSTSLHELESIVERGRGTFIEVGLALARIREAKLYKATHSSWEDYCRRRWGWGRNYADKLVRASAVAEDVAQLGTMLPTERHARALARVPVEDRPAVIEEAHRIHAERARHEGGSGERSVHFARGAGEDGASLAVVGDAGVASLAVRDLEEAVSRRADGKAKSPSLQTRRTPRWFYDALDERFGPFALDAYAAPHNAMHPNFYTREQDGNAQPWEDVTFANPEFAEMVLPVAKAVEEAKRGVRSIVLGPVGCAQEWYHELAIQGTIYVPDLRIQFDEPDGTPTDRADRDTIVMAFGGEHTNRRHVHGIFQARRLEVKHLRPDDTEA